MNKIYETTEPYEVNGKLWHKVLMDCHRCGGTGHFSYNPVDGTMCYGCRGLKKVWKEMRYLSDKEKAQRERARVRRAARKEEERKAQLEEKNTQIRERLGFTGTSIYVVTSPDTFSIKDELKEAGAKFKSCFGVWFFSEPTDLYPTVEMMDGELLELDTWGEIKAREDAETIIKARIQPLIPEPKSQWIGNIGDKVELELTLKREHSFESQYGWKYIYIFEDDNGNVFKWSTGKVIMNEDDRGYEFIQKGNRATVRGTIKEHTEYRGTKQTELTRCKVQF